MGKLEEEAHRIAAHALGQQEQELSGLQARTGSLLTAASVIASFLGGQALTRAGFSAWVVLALVAFGVSVVLCIYVLLPKKRLIFVMNAPKTYNELYEADDDEEEIYRKLAYWLESFRQDNEAEMGRLGFVFRIAGVFLLVELVLLAIGLSVS
jgi:hypothetical protein